MLRSGFELRRTLLGMERDMKLVCEGCDAVVEGETADELHAAMMAHSEDVHSNVFAGKTPEQAEDLRQQVDDHVRKMIADLG